MNQEVMRTTKLVNLEDTIEKQILETHWTVNTLHDHSLYLSE